MKKFELAFAAILIPLDYLSLLLAGTLAYLLRFESFVTEIRPVIFELDYSAFFRILAGVALSWLAIYALAGLYVTKRLSLASIIGKVFMASGAATLLIVIAFFFNFQLFSSRLIIITGWALGIIIVSLERILIHYLKKLFYQKGIGCRQAIIIGSGRNADDIEKEFLLRPGFGFKTVKRFLSFGEADKAGLQELLSQIAVDDVILADNSLSEPEKADLVDFCLNHQLNYKFAASLLETKLVNFDLSTVAGVPLIEVKQTKLDGWGRIIKRIFDIFCSILLIVIFSPFSVICGLLIILTSKGPIIVKLPRVGYAGKAFGIYKFRSMVAGAHGLKKELASFNERGDGPLFKMKNDPRITVVGRFIRRWSLDELPQFFNVLFGTMSLVGPRPHEPEEVAKYQTGHKKLLYVKPGITGMAQVSGRSNLEWAEEVRLDSYYLENWSLGLDLGIMLKTPISVIKGARAV